LLLPIDVYTALLIGVIVGGTSSAVVVPLIRILKLADRPGTILVMESALTDVLAVVLSLALMRGMQTGFSATVIAGDVAAAFLLAALIGAVGAFVWSAVLPKIRQVPNTVFTTIAYVLILFGLTELWGYSGAIAALSFGIGVANLPNIPQSIQGRVITFRLAGFSDVERTFFAEAVFLVKTFFFVFLGISIGFSNTRAVLVGLLLSVIAVLGRLVMVRLLVPRTVMRRHALLMTALIPKGLAAAVLAGMPSQLGLANGDIIQSTVYAVIFFTILICAILVFAIESGRLDGLAAGFFAPFATEPSGPTTTAYVVPSFEQSLGLPALQEEYLEPNIVDLSDDQIPRDDESTPTPPSPL
jgi:NhaP-type Na+/H+ or K+/H+ antiporter